MTQNNQEKEVRAIVVPVTPFQQNCSIVWCIETKMGAVFDPGGDLENILQADVIEIDINTKDTKIFMYEENEKVNIKNKNY